MLPRDPSPRSPRDSGRINFVSTFMLAAIVAAGYLAVVYVPLYIDNWSLKRVIREAANEAWKQRDDEVLRLNILRQSQDIAKQEVVVDGNRQWRGGLTILAEDVFITRDIEHKTCTIQVKYDREAIFPWINRKTVVHFAPFVTESTQQITW